MFECEEEYTAYCNAEAEAEAEMAAMEAEALEEEYNELKSKIETLLRINNELRKYGICSITHGPGIHFGFKETVDISRKFNIVPEIIESGSYEFPYQIILPDLKIYAIGSVKEMVKYKLIEAPEGYSEYEKQEFAELKVKLMAAETENRRLKAILGAETEEDDE